MEIKKYGLYALLFFGYFVGLPTALSPISGG